MNYYNTDIQFKYELLRRKIFRLTLVLSQDMDAEPCKNDELKGGLKMQKIFMTAKEVQDFLEVSRTTAYQLINEMNQELTKLGYRVQRGKVNRQYFMEKKLEKRCKGEKLNKKKRGFSTKKEALNWEKEFLSQQDGTVEMTFREFFELY